jgi:hypothetical protein
VRRRTVFAVLVVILSGEGFLILIWLKKNPPLCSAGPFLRRPFASERIPQQPAGNAKLHLAVVLNRTMNAGNDGNYGRHGKLECVTYRKEGLDLGSTPAASTTHLGCAG